jgi:hypothetical protein
MALPSADELIAPAADHRGRASTLIGDTAATSRTRPTLGARPGPAGPNPETVCSCERIQAACGNGQVCTGSFASECSR